MTQAAHLRTAKELVDEICDTIGPGFTRTQARNALRRAVSRWSSCVKPCFCKTIEARCGQCEYDLGCCGIHSDIVPWVQRAGCGCGVPNCWHRLLCYDLSCGNLVTDGSISGKIKLEYRVEQPPVLREPVELSSPYRPGDRTIWIKGKIDNLPPAGYVKVCDTWVSYQCYAEIRYDGPELFDVTKSEAWLNPGELISEEIISKQPLLDGSGDDIDEGIACGVHTVLSSVDPHCISRASLDYYPVGTRVSMGYAAGSSSDYNYLFNLAMLEAYRTRMTSCNSGTERDVAYSLIQYYTDEVNRSERMAGTQAEVRVVLDYWKPRSKEYYGGDNRTSSRRYIAGGEAVCC